LTNAKILPNVEKFLSDIL